MANMKASISTIDQLAASMQALRRERKLSAKSSLEKNLDISIFRKTKDEVLEAKLSYSLMDDAIMEVSDKQAVFNAQMERSCAIAATWEKQVNKVKNALGKTVNIKSLANLSDNLVNSDARINTVLLTFDDGDSIEEIQRKVMASAQQCRTPYFDAVDSVTDLALNAKDTFGSLDEVIGFYTLMTKEFRLGGTAIAQQKAGMTQLISAMSTGALTAQDMVMLLDTAPDMVQNIADYMNAPVERLQSLAAEGQITADVVKNAMFNAIDEINSRFGELPMTWSQAWTVMGNVAMTALSPLLLAVNWLVKKVLHCACRISSPFCLC